MRAADALEKFSITHAALLQPHADELLSEMFDDGSKEVRWHLISITSRVTLSGAQAARFVQYLASNTRLP
jgi:hypothetical protein